MPTLVLVKGKLPGRAELTPSHLTSPLIENQFKNYRAVWHGGNFWCREAMDGELLVCPVVRKSTDWWIVVGQGQGALTCHRV